MAFPAQFSWGAGASASAAVGTAPNSDLGAWEASGRAPSSGSGAGLGPEDLTLLADAGLTHLRLVLDWSRLEPEPGRHDRRATEDALALLGEAADRGLTVWGCLHDGALPGWFSVDEPGFADRRTRGYHWARHVEWVGETFGELVGGWVPVFEPNRWATRGWIDGARPPGHHDDAEGFAEALEGVLLATVDAAQRLRQGGRPVASAHWGVPVFAARTDPAAPVSAEAEVLARTVDGIHHGCWVRLLEQDLLEVPGRAPIEVPGARAAFDIVGVTYRHAVAVRGDGAMLPYPQALAVGPDGQVPWTEGLAVVLHRLAEDLPDRPLLIAGIGVDARDEGQRRDQVRDLLSEAHDAITGGIDLRGAWWRTPIDPVRPAVDTAAGTPGLWDHERNPRPAAELVTRVAHGETIPT